MSPVLGDICQVKWGVHFFYNESNNPIVNAEEIAPTRWYELVQGKRGSTKPGPQSGNWMIERFCSVFQRGEETIVTSEDYEWAPPPGMLEIVRPDVSETRTT